MLGDCIDSTNNFMTREARRDEPTMNLRRTYDELTMYDNDMFTKAPWISHGVITDSGLSGMDRKRGIHERKERPLMKSFFSPKDFGFRIS